MARIRLVDFGGLFPSVPARALADNAAQISENLLATAREFRPLGEDTQVVANSGVSNPKTLYRLARTSSGAFNIDMTTGWIVNANALNFARGNASDDSERTYYTRADGAAPPRVLDAQGEDRHLGVPAPTTAPGATVNVVDEFTPEDRGFALEAAKQTAISAIRACAIPVWRGATAPGTSTEGYLDSLADYGFPYPDPSVQVRVYRLDGENGAVSNSYSSVDASYFSWIFDPQLHGTKGQSNGTPAWGGGTGTWHFGFTYKAYGLTYDTDAETLADLLQAVEMPGTDDGTKLLTPQQVTDTIEALQEKGDPDGPVVGPMIQALAGKVQELQVLLDGGSRGSLAAMTEAFYEKPDVAATIAAAKQNFANSVWNAAFLAVHSSLPVDYTGAGPGDGGSGVGDGGAP